jgi:hypothetical protein
MAKKKVDSITKTEAVRKAIAAGVDKPTDGVIYVKEKFGVEVTPSQFSTYKSLAKLKGAGSHGKTARNGHGSPGMATSIEAIKTLVDDLGVEEVVSIARLFGK